MAAQSDRIHLACMHVLNAATLEAYGGLCIVCAWHVGQEERCATKMVARPLLAPVCDSSHAK